MSDRRTPVLLFTLSMGISIVVSLGLGTLEIEPSGRRWKPLEERLELGIEGGAEGWTEVTADLKGSELRSRIGRS